jgi:DNA polymerase III delta subunit
MLSNVYLFTGEERFLLDRELTRRKENFVLKYGADSIFAFDFENLDMGMVKQAIYSGGLFVSKKMIILQGIPYEGTTKPSAALQEQVEKFIEEFIAKEGKIPEEALLVFVSGKPDKRLKFYKFLERNANVKEFTQYKDSELKDFIISQLPGLYIPSEVIEYFLIKVGPDLYRLWFECEKLATWCQLKQVKTIDQAMIDKVAWGMVETNAFSLLETMFTNYPNACALLDKIKDDGDDRNKFAGMLYRSLKQSLFLLDVYESGTHDSKEIAARL